MMVRYLRYGSFVCCDFSVGHFTGTGIYLLDVTHFVEFGNVSIFEFIRRKLSEFESVLKTSMLAKVARTGNQVAFQMLLE